MSSSKPVRANCAIANVPGYAGVMKNTQTSHRGYINRQVSTEFEIATRNIVPCHAPFSQYIHIRSGSLETWIGRQEIAGACAMDIEWPLLVPPKSTSELDGILQYWGYGCELPWTHVCRCNAAWTSRWTRYSDDITQTPLLNFSWILSQICIRRITRYSLWNNRNMETRFWIIDYCWNFQTS